MLVVTSDLLSVSFTVARKSMMSTKGLLSAARYREQDTCRYRSYSVNTVVLHTRLKLNLTVRISSDIMTENYDQIWVLCSMTACVLPTAARAAAGPVVFWQPCRWNMWNGNSPCLTVDSSHWPRPECCWKPSIENVLTLWILILAKTHFNRGRW